MRDKQYSEFCANGWRALGYQYSPFKLNAKLGWIGVAGSAAQMRLNWDVVHKLQSATLTRGAEGVP